MFGVIADQQGEMVFLFGIKVDCRLKLDLVVHQMVRSRGVKWPMVQLAS